MAIQRYRILGTDKSYNIFGRTTSTDATEKTLGTLTPPANCTFGLEATIVARRTSGSSGTAGDSAMYKIAAVYKVVNGTVTLVGAVRDMMTASESQAAWAATFDVSSNTVRVRVTGAANNNVEWEVFGTVYRLGGR